ncbi:hypothetical protein [Micromonospora sp. DT233]|uniref:hypothetical protein n=1 Tax=Micromonospora sp. DT233 TaxID=3393432 RepID=UPI003CEF2412
MTGADDPRRPGRAPVPARPAALVRRLTSGELEAYLVSGAALVVGALGLLNVTSPDVVAAATLTVLGVITFDLLTGRRRLRGIESTLRELTRRLRPEGGESADRLLTAAMPGGAVGLAGARDIRLVGVTLSRTIRSHLDDLRQQLAAGATVRVALIDPAGPAPEEAARRNGLPEGGGEVFTRRIQPTIDLLDYLAGQEGGGRLEVRLLHFVPAFGMALLDPEESTGHLSIDVYSHRPDGREATLTLRADRDPVWYRHFTREFDQVWAAGRSRDGRSLT